MKVYVSVPQNNIVSGGNPVYMQQGIPMAMNMNPMMQQQSQMMAQQMRFPMQVAYKLYIICTI